MKAYDVVKEVKLPLGTIVRLSASQSHSGNGIEAVGPRGWFKITGEMIRRRGEVVVFLETPDEITLQALLACEDWPSPLPYDPAFLSPSEAETYYTIKNVTFARGIVMRLLAEQALKRQHSVEPLGQHWFRARHDISFKIGEMLQFREVPKSYLRYLAKPPCFSAAPSPVAELPLSPLSQVRLTLSRPEGLSAPQQTAWALLATQDTLRMQQLKAAYPQVTRRTLHRELEKMVQKGLLAATGSNRYAQYQVANKDACSLSTE